MKVRVHEIALGDVEDPEIYAAEPMLNFERTEQGQWLHKNSYKQMEFIIRPNEATYGWKVIIFAFLKEKELTYYKLKWGVQNEL
jgi:hypothetical protein